MYEHCQNTTTTGDLCDRVFVNATLFLLTSWYIMMPILYVVALLVYKYSSLCIHSTTTIIPVLNTKPSILSRTSLITVIHILCIRSSIKTGLIHLSVGVLLFCTWVQIKQIMQVWLKGRLLSPIDSNCVHVSLHTGIDHTVD